MPKVEINRERCKGCGYCIPVCPNKVLTWDSAINNRGIKPVVVVKPDKCTGCSLCAYICPDICIEVWR